MAVVPDRVRPKTLTHFTGRVGKLPGNRSDYSGEGTGESVALSI